MNCFINGVEVPELTQEQMNELVRRRVRGGHKVSQNGDSFDAYTFHKALEVVQAEMSNQLESKASDSTSPGM